MNELLIGFLAAALVLAFALFFVVTKFGPKRSLVDRAYYQEQWQRISGLASGSQAEQHLAVFEADKLLDHALKARGMGGQTMGDRLKSARSRFSNNNMVWQAHKLRNRLAHEAGVSVSYGELSAAMSAFKSALRDLGVL